MAINVATLEARLVANTTDFDRGMDRGEKKMGGFSKAASGAGGYLGCPPTSTSR